MPIKIKDDHFNNKFYPVSDYNFFFLTVKYGTASWRQTSKELILFNTCS